MAAFDTIRPVAVFGGGYITKKIANLVAFVHAWNETRITRNALSKLTDRELDDIGLSRADVNRLDTLAH